MERSLNADTRPRSSERGKIKVKISFSHPFFFSDRQSKLSEGGKQEMTRRLTRYHVETFAT